MRIQPEKKDWELAAMIYDIFKKKPGAQHIASRFALAHLSRILSAKRPQKILELGAGIGTTTYLLCHHPHKPERIVVTEENDFCLEQLHRNINERCINRIEIIENPKNISFISEKFDLIIFDSSHDEIDVTRLIKEGAICFVEGSRKPTREVLQRRLQQIGLRCNFDNHSQGRKIIHVTTKKKKILRISIPKIKFFKKIKGCWIGRVERI